MKDPFGSSLLVSSSNVALKLLQRVFHKTTASYKFLWFLAILDLVKEAPQDAGPLRLSISMICARMVAKSWIPTQRFKLSFGRWDQITAIIEALKNPYYFPENDLSFIEISTEWRKYFLENYALLKDFAYWNFADFLQTRNTAVPALVKKFELPDSRISLETQRKFWAPFLTSSRLARDIYGNQLDLNNFALDHFLPWTFVVHNQIWNLTPMDRRLNSSKNDQIPQDTYIRPLALQHKNLVRYHFSKDRKRSEDFFAEYENFLGVEIADFVSASDAQVIELFQEHLDPLQQTALNMGFPLWQ